MMAKIKGIEEEENNYGWLMVGIGVKEGKLGFFNLFIRGVLRTFYVHIIKVDK